MDTLTHALSTLLVARATLPRAARPGQLSLTARSWSGFFAGAFPDLDFLVWFFGITPYLNYHRGITHSFLLMPVWSLLLAGLFSLISRRRYHWRAFYLVCLISLCVHICGDVITSYGTMVFAPFSDYKLAVPTTFILDWYFSGIVLAGLSVSFISTRYKAQAARAGVGALLCYVSAQAWWMHMARAEAYATMPRSNPVEASVYVLPQPVSPFNWKLIVETPDRYFVRYVNLYRDKIKQTGADANMFQRADTLYLPRSDSRWEVIPKFGNGSAAATARRIWDEPGMRDIRRFMQFPAVQYTDAMPGFTCVWFADQKFVLGDLRSPFVFGGCETRDGKQRQLLRLVDGQRMPLQ